MKLYYISISSTNTPEQHIFNYAFTERVNAEDYAAVINRRTLTKIASVHEINLPFIGRSVCYVKEDAGIALTFGTMPMHEDITNSRIYACIEHAKTDPLWQRSKMYFERNPKEKMHETDTMIATDDGHGEPFSWGNYHGFVTTIERIRVIKAGMEYNEDIVEWWF